MLRRLAVISILAACGGGSSDQPAGDSGQLDGPTTDAPAEGTLSLTVPSGTLRLLPATTEVLEVEVAIGAGLGEVTVSAEDLPAGVTIASRTISASGTLELAIVTAGDAPPLAAPVALAIVARDQRATKRVLVADLPGTLDRSLDQDGELVIPLSAQGLSGSGFFANDYAFYLTDHNISAVARFKPNGTRDASFVMQGPASSTSFRVLPVDATNVAIVRGFLGGQDVALHSATGQRLTSFAGGLLALPYASAVRFEANALWIMGAFNPDQRGRFATVSLAGQLTNITTADAFAMDNYSSFALDATKRITFGGEHEVSALVGRLTAAGAIDTTFSQDGSFEVISPFAQASQASSIDVKVVTAPDGSGHALLTFFSTNINVGPRSKLLGFSSTGEITVAPFDVTTVSLDSLALTLARQPDGKLLVAGKDAGTGFVARYLPTGTLDGSFGTGGRLVLPREPRAAHVFVEDGRAVLTANDDTFNAAALHIYRIWL